MVERLIVPLCYSKAFRVERLIDSLCVQCGPGGLKTDYSSLALVVERLIAHLVTVRL